MLRIVLSFILCVSFSIKAFPQENIKIGIVTSLTGNQSPLGTKQKYGYDMMLEEINKKGGVLGKKIQLIYEDDASKPQIAMSAFEKLATRDNVPVVAGTYSSGATLPMAVIAERHKVPLVSPTAATDKLTQQGFEYVFRINAPSSEYAKSLIDFAYSLGGIKTIAFLYENTEFGSNTSSAGKEYSKKMGLKIVADESYSSGLADYRPILTKTKSARPDALFIVSYLADAIILMRQIKEINLLPKIFLGGGAGFTVPQFIENVKDSAEYITTTTQWHWNVNWSGAKEFRDNFTKRYKEDPEYHSVEAYVALHVIVDAIKRAKSLDRDKIRDALKLTNMNTAFGLIKFEDYNGYTNQNRHPMLILQIQKGEFLPVYPKEYAKVKAIYPFPGWR